MTPMELATAAADALGKNLENVQLVLPRPANGRARMVVFGKPRLYGEVACENAEGHAVGQASAPAPNSNRSRSSIARPGYGRAWTTSENRPIYDRS